MLPCYETRGWKVRDAEGLPLSCDPRPPKFPHVLLASGWKVASDARVLRGSLASAFPPVLHVVAGCTASPQLGKAGVCLGCNPQCSWRGKGPGPLLELRYQILWDEYLNGQPVWGRAEPGESCLLYSSCDGFWCISRQAFGA